MKSLIKKVAKVVVRNSLKMKKKKIDEPKNRKILSIRKKRRKKTIRIQRKYNKLIYWGEILLFFEGLDYFYSSRFIFVEGEGSQKKKKK